MSTFYNREAEKDRKRFADHKATWDGRVLQWAKPDTGIDLITYILHNHYLFVVGDLGDAIFHWAGHRDKWITLDLLREISHKHLLQKCLASEVGSDFRAWDNATARDWLDGELTQDLPWVQRERLTVLSQTSLDQACFDYTAELLDGDGFDGETTGAVRDAGLAPHPRFVAQYVGLQMAIEQVDDNYPIPFG